MEIEGKAAIVTGGGTGVGRATALALAQRGCSVLVNYSRSKAEAEQTAAECAAFGVWAFPLQGDVSQDADCRALVECVMDEFGQLDILVQSAGTTVFVPHHDLDAISAEDFHKVLDVNLIGPFQMARAARHALEKSGQGSMVMISSVAGVRAVGSSIPYCASKAALNNLTIALARVMAPKVRVNAIAPGAITGRWLREGYGDQAYEALMEGVKRRVPLGKASEPEDVAAGVLGLIGADMVTGQVLVLDGGMLIAS